MKEKTDAFPAPRCTPHPPHPSSWAQHMLVFGCNIFQDFALAFSQITNPLSGGWFIFLPVATWSCSFTDGIEMFCWQLLEWSSAQPLLALSNVGPLGLCDNKVLVGGCISPELSDRERNCWLLLWAWGGESTAHLVRWECWLLWMYILLFSDEYWNSSENLYFQSKETLSDVGSPLGAHEDFTDCAYTMSTGNASWNCQLRRGRNCSS